MRLPAIIITGQGKSRAFFIFAVVVLIFEWAAFASAGAIGMMIGQAWIFEGVSFVDAWSGVLSDVTANGYFLIPLLCLMANGFVEAAGPIYFGIEGVPGIEAARKQIYK